MDLLTVLLHELGHALGLHHAEIGIMRDRLAVGHRVTKLPLIRH